jgi:CHAT domain-containing protein
MEYRDSLQTLYAAKDSLEAELSRTCADFKDELAARRFTVSDVASALPDEAVLWEFIRYNPFDFEMIGSDEDRTGPPRYAAFTLDHEGSTTLIDIGDASEIDSLVNLAREQIYRARSDVHSPHAAESEGRLGKVTGRIYDMIFGSLKPCLDGRTDIFVSPDGQLSLLPLEVLSCPDGGYVIEKYRISYLSSGRDLLRYRRKQEQGHWALIMADPAFGLSEESLIKQRDETLAESNLFYLGNQPSRGTSGCFSSRFDPLPYSREEALSVAKTLERDAGLKAELCCGADALEEVLKAMATAPSVLHLATHGYFCEDLDLAGNEGLENPLLRSGLALAGANRVLDTAWKNTQQVEDGVLTAFEASGLNLVGTRLVVLSTCESGVGQVKNGEGVYGLRRAFQCAGAQTVVMSLWKVPDQETGLLMDALYDKWLTGLTKKEALRQSALEVLNSHRVDDGVTHPFFWGGFVLVGNPE